MRKYILLDANVVAAYYLPHSHRSSKVRSRIKGIFDAKLSKSLDLFFYLPNFCVAEVFGVFMKHSFGSWNHHVRKTIDTRVYKSLVKQFRKDIHNASVIHHHELTRYHILGVNLVAPVDNYFRFSKSKGHVSPMGTYDQLIISMGVHLNQLHGKDKVAIVSADDRLTNILKKCKSNIPDKTKKKLQLDECKKQIGIDFSPDVFPAGLNLKTCTDRHLEEFFGMWPILGRKPPIHYRFVR